MTESNNIDTVTYNIKILWISSYSSYYFVEMKWCRTFHSLWILHILIIFDSTGLDLEDLHGIRITYEKMKTSRYSMLWNISPPRTVFAFIVIGFSIEINWSAQKLEFMFTIAWDISMQSITIYTVTQNR